MKLVSIFKSIPLLASLIIIILLNIMTQKEYSKLKILIWSTPSLPVGMYIAISHGTGFILSYILSSNLAKANQLKPRREIKYKSVDEPKADSVYQESNYQTSYDNILIERDIKDPAPTVNASFRVIGDNIRKKQSSRNNYPNEYDTYDNSGQSYNQYYKEDSKYKVGKEINPILNDWEDDTYLNW